MAPTTKTTAVTGFSRDHAHSLPTFPLIPRLRGAIVGLPAEERQLMA
jgi:hypothetical protein